MSVHSASTREPVRNQAQEERGAAAEERKSFTDTPQIRGGETWSAPSGHSGTRRAWAVSAALLVSFVLGGVGMTFGPRLLLWIGSGLFVAFGVYSLATHSWSDFTPQSDEESAEVGRAD